MKKSLLKVENSFPTPASERLPALKGEGLAFLKSYIAQPEFKVLLNNIVRMQAAYHFRSLSVLSRDSSADRSFFICAVALAYTCYLQSRVLIVDTIEQPRGRSLLLDCIVGEHQPEGNFELGGEPGFIDLLSTESFREGERELADFQLGEYVRRVQDNYDLVLVNTAPLASSSEDQIHPLIISRFMDYVILLTGANDGAIDELEPIVALIRKNEMRLLGIVEGISHRRQKPTKGRRLIFGSREKGTTASDDKQGRRVA